MCLFAHIQFLCVQQNMENVRHRIPYNIHKYRLYVDCVNMARMTWDFGPRNNSTDICVVFWYRIAINFWFVVYNISRRREECYNFL